MTAEIVEKTRRAVTSGERPFVAAGTVAGAMVDVMIATGGMPKTAEFLRLLHAHVAAECPPGPNHTITEI